MLNAGYGRQTGTNPIVNDQGFPLEGQYNATSAQFTGGAEFVILSATGERIGPLEQWLYKQRNQQNC